MALTPHSPKEDNAKDRGIKVEGDLGELQISTTSDSDDDDTVMDNAICSKNVGSVSEFPSSLVQTSNAPIYGHVAVANSKNVQLGNNTHFHGPVIIKQIIQNKSGVENVSYTKTEEDTELSEQYNHSAKTKAPATAKKYHFQPWHKVMMIATCFIILAVVSMVVLLIQGKSSKSATSTSNGEEERPNNTTVVGEWLDNFALIIFSISLAVLTMLLMFNTLLTPHMREVDERNTHNTSKNIIPDTNQYDDDLNAIVASKAADDILIAPNLLRIVSRTDWLAQPPEGSETVLLRQPVPWVIITHTATENCSVQTECVLRVRLIQMLHIESRKWDDIGYNFLVGGDGSAYYGRGWDVQGAHTLGYNKYSIGIGFIGTFNKEPPPPQQIEACKKLIQLGVSLGKLSKDYKLFGHRQLSSTLSPGDKLFEIIKTWPHFVSDLSNVSALIPPY